MILSPTRLETPVSIIFFRRPDTLRAVIERVREVRPRKLYLIADGPRSHVEGEAERCAETRELADSMIDWPCRVERNYAERNMGCGPRPATGISWVLGREPASIILEDDCVPDPTFFHYCQELLERYADDRRIAQVCGASFHPERLDRRFSYGYSRYTLCWGWATWSRAWKHFDYSMSEWPKDRENGFLRTIFDRHDDLWYWDRHLQRVWEGDDSVWDMRWTYAVWRQRMLSIIPTVNLVSNVGFGADSTHTSADMHGGHVPSRAMEFPLRHVPLVLRASEHDELIERNLFRKGGQWGLFKQRLKKRLPTGVVNLVRMLKARRLELIGSALR